MGTKNFTKKEMVHHNIDLTFDFLKAVVKNPKLLVKMKNDSAIEFVQSEIPMRERRNGLRKTSYVKVGGTFEIL
jgi:hypothetical protein